MGILSGRYWNRARPEATGYGVNKAMLKGALADAGDTVKLAILGPEPEPPVPADLLVALATSNEAKTLWDDLTTMGRHDWGPLGRIRPRNLRPGPAGSHGRSNSFPRGKRRACCVNVYEVTCCAAFEKRG